MLSLLATVVELELIMNGKSLTILQRHNYGNIERMDKAGKKLENFQYRIL